jgi:hypothetical protein
MRTRVALALAAALMLLISLAAVGSNMGFKITIPLTAGYANYVSLPYYSNYTNAASLLADIPNCTAVKRWDNSTGTYQMYTGRGTNFTVIEGEGYIVNVSVSGSWVVVGSHDPGFALPLTAGYANYVSIPYHTTATNASTLLSQIPNCTAVKRWDNPTGTYQMYTGRGTNFPLTPGEAIIVNVGTTCTWAPAHY